MKSRQSPLTILVIACLLLVTYLVSPVHAVQKSLAGKIDWHKSLIGVPRQDLTPAFISLLEGKDGLVLVTERNVLAVLDAEDGQVVWRQMLEPEDVVVSYEISADGQFLAAKGQDGSETRDSSLRIRPYYSHRRHLWIGDAHDPLILVVERACSVGNATRVDRRPSASTTL